MAYERTTWENGITPINAANLNNIEEGINEAKTEVRSIEAGGTGADNVEDILINLGMVAVIVEAGTSGIWNYIKLSNGQCLLFGSVSGTSTIPNATGNGYYSEDKSITLPDFVNGNVKITAQLSAVSAVASWVGRLYRTGNLIKFNLCTVNKVSTNSNYTVDFVGMADWK